MCSRLHPSQHTSSLPAACAKAVSAWLACTYHKIEELQIVLKLVYGNRRPGRNAIGDPGRTAITVTDYASA
jgi:hypothetical protein